MKRVVHAPGKPQVWAGVECSYLEVGGRTVDQISLSGHRERASDIDLLASLAPKAVRYPVLWGWPDGGPETDWEWAADRLGRLRSYNINPVVGLLHHGYGPAGRSALDDDWVDAFANYAGKVARRFPDVDTYLPINEPLTTARFAGLYGWWPPYSHRRDTFVRLIVNQCLAIRAAIRSIREVRPDAALVVNEDNGKTYGTPALSSLVEWDNNRRWLAFDLLTGRVDSEHPLWEYLNSVKPARAGLESLRDDPEPPTVVGLDYYVTSDRWLDHRVALYPRHVTNRLRGIHHADVELSRLDGDPIDGFARCLRETWDRYGIPIALTEVDLAGDDADKMAWWSEAWDAACDAVANGISVTGITAWSVFGAFDWASVLRRADGTYEPGAFDVRQDPPRPTHIGATIAATSIAAPENVYQIAGWWRRDDRAIYRRPRIRRSGQGGIQKTERIPAHDAIHGGAGQTGLQQGIAKNR